MFHTKKHCMCAKLLQLCLTLQFWKGGRRGSRRRELPGVLAAGSLWPWAVPFRVHAPTSPLCLKPHLSINLEHMRGRASPRVALDGQMALLLPYALACLSIRAGRCLCALLPGLGSRSCCRAGHWAGFPHPLTPLSLRGSVHTWPRAQLGARDTHREG